MYKETQLPFSFGEFHLFDLVFLFFYFLIHYSFPDDLKLKNVVIFLWFESKAHFEFCHRLLMKLMKLPKVIEKRNEKVCFHIYIYIFFHFRLFETFWNLETGFSIILKNVSEELLMLFYTNKFIEVSIHHKKCLVLALSSKQLDFLVLCFDTNS